jgi:hypothetical protein
MLMQRGEVRLVLVCQEVFGLQVPLLLPLLLLLQGALQMGWQHQKEALAWVQQQGLQQSSPQALLLLPSHLLL